MGSRSKAGWIPIWTADWYAPCSGESVGDRFTGGGCEGEHGGVDGVGDKGGDDVAPVWIVRLVLFIVAGCEIFSMPESDKNYLSWTGKTHGTLVYKYTGMANDQAR